MYRDKIWKKDIWYTLLRPFVDRTTRNGYKNGQIEVVGYKNIPKDGAVIIAPNHCNTLMDALVILQAFKDETVFGARADIFNKPAIAKIMYFLRILPQVRQRDGLRNVLKNNDTQEIIVETLENKVRFCIFPEGKHRPAHSLQPLGKGVFRAALAANAKFGDRFPVYIVPTGIEYGDYFRYGSTALVNFGEAINVTEFVRANPVENEAQLIEPLKKELAGRMSELITFIKDDEQLADKWTLTKIISMHKGYGTYVRDLHDEMMANRKIVAEIEGRCEEKPEEMSALLEKVSEFEKERRKSGISVKSFREKNNAVNRILRSLLSIIVFPIWILSAIASFPIWLTYYILRGKIKDKAFGNTVGFGGRFAFGWILALTFIILAICLKEVFIILFGLPMICSNVFWSEEYFRILVSDFRITGNKKMQGFYKEIIEEYNKL